jgi:shikimate kinase
VGCRWLHFDVWVRMAGHVILIGLSGSGKSHVGRVLSDRLGWPFFDTDEQIVRREGRQIAEIFRDSGESWFRQIEREEVARACASPTPAIVSLGGGAIVDDASREIITRGNLVVRLDAAIERLVERLTASPDAEIRPLLGGPDPIGRLRAMRAMREQFYRVASLTIDTTDRSPEDIASEIMSRLEQADSRYI